MARLCPTTAKTAVQTCEVMGMTDCVGKEINVGDKVICADSRYADLLIGEVIKLTPQKAWVRYHRSEYGKQYINEKLKESYQVFKYVEVVRCEDCKYRVLDTVSGEDWCNHTLGLCSEVYATDFCCHGERKDNDLQRKAD